MGREGSSRFTPFGYRSSSIGALKTQIQALTAQVAALTAYFMHPHTPVKDEDIAAIKGAAQTIARATSGSTVAANHVADLVDRIHGAKTGVAKPANHQ
jgi:hypothetical protein